TRVARRRRVVAEDRRSCTAPCRSFATLGGLTETRCGSCVARVRPACQPFGSADPWRRLGALAAWRPTARCPRANRLGVSILRESLRLCVSAANPGGAAQKRRTEAPRAHVHQGTKLPCTRATVHEWPSSSISSC